MSITDQRTRGPEAYRHSEGEIARTIEDQTARIPSDMYLWAAVGSGAVSAMFHMSGDWKRGQFVGQWVAPFLLLGIYNKLVKIGGSDRIHRS